MSNVGAVLLVHSWCIYIIYEELIQTRSLQYMCVFYCCALCICIQTLQYASVIVAAVLICYSVVELLLDAN